MHKTAIGASLPEDLFQEFTVRTGGFPGGKTGLIKESLRAYFDANPMTEQQREELVALRAADEQKA